MEHVSVHLHNLQFGFLKGKSTTAQLLRVLHEIGESQDKRVQTDAIYLDFTKAFDRVDHRLLVKKLHQYGICGNLLKWFESYLSDRYQKVTVLGATSQPIHVLSGVPQGSILGPLLFLIYVNDLPKATTSSSVALYADDTKCFHGIKTSDDVIDLQRDLDKICKWCDVWRMDLNQSKCSLRAVPDFPKEEGTAQLRPHACYACFPDFEENNLCMKINALNMQLVANVLTNMAATKGALFDSVNCSVAISTACKFLNVEKFYPDQEEALRNFFQGKDLFFSAHTGYGKSLIFQAIPIIADVLEDQLIGTSTVLVISPLLSLMKDQVRNINENFGISAAAIFDDQDEEVLKAIEEGVYSLVYASPEYFVGKKHWRTLASSRAFREDCVAVVVDEAHCLVHW